MSRRYLVKAPHVAPPWLWGLTVAAVAVGLSIGLDLPPELHGAVYGALGIVVTATAVLPRLLAVSVWYDDHGVTVSGLVYSRRIEHGAIHSVTSYPRWPSGHDYEIGDVDGPALRIIWTDQRGREQRLWMGLPDAKARAIELRKAGAAVENRRRSRGDARGAGQAS